MVKTSILLFYRRLLGGVRVTLQRVIMALFILNIVLTVAQLLQLLLQCTPTHAVYDPIYQSKHPGACGWGTPKQLSMSRLTYYVLMPSHLLIDVLILLLPVKVVFQLPLPKPQRTAVRALFGIAAFACAACAVRLYYVYRMVFHFSRMYNLPQTPTNANCGCIPAYRHPHFDVICWGQVEATVGLTVACAPSIRSFFTRPIPRPRGQQSDNNGQQYWCSTSGPASALRGSRANPHWTPGSSICNGVDPECLTTSHIVQEYGLAYPYPKEGTGGREYMMDDLQFDGIATTRGYIQHEEEIDGRMEHNYPENRGEYLDEAKVPPKSNNSINSGGSISAFAANSSQDDYDHGGLCHTRDELVVSEGH